MIPRLTPAQVEALQYIRARAESRGLDTTMALQGFLVRSGVPQETYAHARERLHRRAQVVLHFHPDRLSNQGQSVAEQLLADGIYRSQYETGISNGSPTAFAGGLRDTVEEALFDGIYHLPGSTPGDRPKYGSLDIFHYLDGASPRFGSCYVVLRSTVSPRCTFSYGDSVSKPSHVGTLDAIDGVLAALLGEIEQQGSALGMDGLTIPGFLTYLSQGFAEPDNDPAARRVGRVLDSYIEAQVHGPIVLRADVERLVADPAFRGTATGEHLEAISDCYAIPLQWHPGFSLPIEEVPDDFRGPTMRPLARRIGELAGAHTLNAAVIGVAAALSTRDPDAWSE